MDAMQSTQTYRVRSPRLVELGIFMSNGRADSENGIGESGKAKRRRGEEEEEGGK